jgi:hypothetical protein
MNRRHHSPEPPAPMTKETSKVIRRALFFATILAVALAALLPGAASAASPAPAWKLRISSLPTNFAPGEFPNVGNGSYYKVTASDVGGALAEGPVVITDTLPAGLTPLEAFGSSEEIHCSIAGQTVTCINDGGYYAVLEVGVEVDPNLEEGSTLVDEATITSPGAAPVTASTTTTISSAPASFGFVAGGDGLFASLTEADGEPATLAGSHPNQLTVGLSFPSQAIFANTVAGEGRVTRLGAGGGVRDVRTYLPHGLIVNPQAVRVLCTEAQLSSRSCPDASVIGVANSTLGIGIGAGSLLDAAPVYDMVPPPGSASNFGFEPNGLGVTVHILGGLRSGDYALAARTDDVDALFNHPVFGFQLQLWDDFSSPVYDHERGGCAITGKSCPVGPQSTPLLTMPTSCTGSLAIEAQADSWGEPGLFLSRSAPFTDLQGITTGVTGCDNPELHFNPTLEARPTTNLADSPSGLSVDLHIPQTNSIGTLATAHLRKAVVTLPEGLTLNPSSANSLESCSSAQIGIDPNTGVADGNQPTCPDASRIGEVEVDTPLLDHAALGSVYVATPHDNPFDSLLAIYVVVDDPATGTLIKLAGHVEPNPSTGQLVTTFDNNPQLPFTDFKLSFFNGPGAVLRTPSVCGNYSTTSSLTPWSAPESGPPATPKDEYAISANCSASPAAQPNKPEFEAGTVSPIAGKYTPFVVHLKREDGSQQFKTLTLNPPPGLTTKLAGTPACSDGALAAAAGKSGRDEQQSPSCPSSSRIGTVSVGAGAGPAPYYAKGTAYLAGPYKGAPLSMAIITPAVAGPYDLGTVVTRVALHVNPATTQITAGADPVPSILQGIPLDVRSVDVSLDKPSFSRTGTSCDPFAVTGNLISTLGQSAALESRYQLGNCANLAFKPKLAIKLKGGTKRGKNPALIATLTAKDGEANISSTAVTLPRSAFLDQSHIKTVCTRVQFAAGAGNGAECPTGSIYGTASAKSPLLDYTLIGNAYLRSSNHKLPDLVIALQGPPSQPIAIELDGRTDSVKGALRNTFEAVPDAPVSSFRLELFGGKRGLVINSRNLCANPYKADVLFGAQNGAQLSAKPKVQAQCAKARKKHKRHGHG